MASKSENEATARDEDERDEEESSELAEGSDEHEDEGSDEDESDDEGSDDASDDSTSEASDEESASAAEREDASEGAAGGAADESVEAAPNKKKATGGKGARQFKKDGKTAGARLAAAKAAKAARKAAKLGKEKRAQDPIAAMRDNPLAQKAEQATSWAKQNSTMVWAVLAAVVLGLGGWLGYRTYTESQAEAEAALLEDALEIAQAEIVPEDEEADSADDAQPDDAPQDEDEAPTFPTEQARTEAALEAYRAVIAQYPSSHAAVWARLGEARMLFEQGNGADAREAYETAIREGGGDPAVTWRALEGKAFTFEAEEEWPRALEVYEELARVDDGRYEPIAKYHMARMYLAQDDRDRATETLRTLVDSLRDAENDEEEQDFEYVLAQAQTRLRELDPSAAPPPPSPSFDSPMGGGPGGDLTNEQLQELIRRFQEQQQQQGGGGAE